MEYGIFLAFVGGAIIIASILASAILLINEMSTIKYKAHYAFALGCSMMLLSYPIVKNPTNLAIDYHASCLSSYSYSKIEGVTKEQICLDATTSYKKKVLGL